jgi:hypothetical protein|tara:strand:- start:558 stop:755 length:198 start_codon:yes stop_codon:yes gene_type:complete
MIAKKIGLVFVLFGLFEVFYSRRLCGLLCDTCGIVNLQPCFLLYIFVGIIFLVVGSSLVLSKEFV